MKASQSCQLGDSRTMPCHWTHDFGRGWREKITSAQRMEGRVGKIRGWRLTLEKLTQENGKMQNKSYKQLLLERPENLVAIQRLRKKRVSEQSSSAQSSATEKSKATSTVSVLIPIALPRALAHSWSFSSNLYLLMVHANCFVHTSICSLFNIPDVHILRYLL